MMTMTMTMTMTMMMMMMIMVMIKELFPSHVRVRRIKLILEGLGLHIIIYT